MKFPGVEINKLGVYALIEFLVLSFRIAYAEAFLVDNQVASPFRPMVATKNKVTGVFRGLCDCTKLQATVSSA